MVGESSHGVHILLLLPGGHQRRQGPRRRGASSSASVGVSSPQGTLGRVQGGTSTVLQVLLGEVIRGCHASAPAGHSIVWLLLWRRWRRRRMMLRW